MAGYLVRYPAIWIGNWKSGGLIGRWLAYWLANWRVACSLAGCLTVWWTHWRGWQAGPGDLDLVGYLAGCYVGKLFGWLSD